MAYKIWNDSQPPVPTIFLHSFIGDGREVWEAAHELHCPPFNLVSIHDINLDDSLTPWPAQGVRKGQLPFGGTAHDHLNVILHQIIPEVEQNLPSPSKYLAIAGYSLAGLFALWATTQTDCFKRLACVSASLWYPAFEQFFREKHFAGPLQCAYFSLGDKERQTKHPLMRQVEEITRNIYDDVKQQAIPTCFVMNPGNHFTDASLRMAKGIQWLLSQP